MKFMSVTLDVSRLSGWLNATAFCRVERRACDAGRGAGREAGGRVVASAQAAHAVLAGSVRLKAIGGQGTTEGARAERTANMKSMLVTPEVFQLEMSALNAVASCRVERQACDEGRGMAREA